MTSSRPDEIVAREVTVRGRVQGVFFRDSTRQVAGSVGVAGWVGNAPDGSVRARLEGPAGPVDQVLAFLHHGPPEASVASVEVTEVAAEGLRGFELRRL